MFARSRWTLPALAGAFLVGVLLGHLAECDDDCLCDMLPDGAAQAGGPGTAPDPARADSGFPGAPPPPGQDEQSAGDPRHVPGRPGFGSGAAGGPTDGVPPEMSGVARLSPVEALRLREAEADTSLPMPIHEALAKLPPRERLQVYDSLKGYKQYADQLEAQNERLQVDKSRLLAKQDGTETPSTAEEAAERGEVRFSLSESGVSDQPLEETLLEDLGLDEQQQTAVEEMLRQQTDTLYEDLQTLLAEQTGNPDAGSGYNVVALIEAIREGASRDEFSAAIDRIAQELAGQSQPPDDPASGSVAERMLRAAVEHDQRVREALEELLGPELAAAFLDHDSNKGTFYSFDASGGELD